MPWYIETDDHEIYEATGFKDNGLLIPIKTGPVTQGKIFTKRDYETNLIVFASEKRDIHSYEIYLLWYEEV